MRRIAIDNVPSSSSTPAPAAPRFRTPAPGAPCPACGTTLRHRKRACPSCREVFYAPPVVRRRHIVDTCMYAVGYLATSGRYPGTITGIRILDYVPDVMPAGFLTVVLGHEPIGRHEVYTDAAERLRTRLVARLPWATELIATRRE